MVAPINIAGDTLNVRFDQFGPDNYKLFLRVKALPEYQVAFDDEDFSYTVTAPARFAAMLGVQRPDPTRDWLPVPPWFYEDQRYVLYFALDAKRFACWTECGWGKTLLMLEFARQVIHKTGKKFLIFTLNDLVPQWLEMAQQFYGDSLPIMRLTTRQQMREWCKSSDGPMLGITNYEKMNHRTADDQVVNELRHLGGVGLDESDRLRTGGGVQKWALIKSCRGIEYKLSCTATPAPNDTAEFASQASFLEKLRDQKEIIWTYFTRDPKTHRWAVKKHARKPFFTFMSSWSIYIRDPRRYGWTRPQPEVPEPVVIQHRIPITDQQRQALQRFSHEPSGQLNLLQTKETNTVERGKLSQIAKGFIYLKGKQRRIERIQSYKPKFIADLANEEVADGRRVIIWTLFDAESEILAEALQPGTFQLITGKVKPAERVSRLHRFLAGDDCPILVTRAKMLGYGQNMQSVGAHIFSALNDSYVLYYQAIRRSYRPGQKLQLRVHLPYIEELEGDVLENILGKQARNEADIAEMEANYIAAHRILRGEAA